MARRYRVAGRLGPGLMVFALVVGMAFAVQSIAAKVKVRIDFDKAFDFRQPRSWAWNAQGPGDVMMARTPKDDPAAAKQRAEPLIMDAAAVEMGRRGLRHADTTPDLTLTYYLLLTIGTSAQTRGQFLPAVADWGIPPFTPSTTALSVFPYGSLVFDLSAKGQVVWRGVGEAEIKWDLDDNRRAALVRQAAKEILGRYPPKK